MSLLTERLERYGHIRSQKALNARLKYLELNQGVVEEYTIFYLGEISRKLGEVIRKIKLHPGSS